MKKLILSLLVTLGFISVCITHVKAQDFVRISNPDFDYSYNTVWDSNGLQYVISQQNIQRYDEGLNWASFWAPSTFAQPAILEQKITFQNTTTQIALNFNISGGTGFNTGTAQLDASKDGVNWTTLVQVSGNPNIQYYNSLLPNDLIGSSELWLKTTLKTTGPGYWDPKFAQFSRALSPANSPTTPVFQLQASVIPETAPEPSTYALFGLGALALNIAYRRKVA
jgi:hypothetical protein